MLYGRVASTWRLHGLGWGADQTSRWIEEGTDESREPATATCAWPMRHTTRPRPVMGRMRVPGLAGRGSRAGDVAGQRVVG